MCEKCEIFVAAGFSFVLFVLSELIMVRNLLLASSDEGIEFERSGK